MKGFFILLCFDFHFSKSVKAESVFILSKKRNLISKTLIGSKEKKNGFRNPTSVNISKNHGSEVIS